MNQNNSEELKHYGVPGMRWGHRKSIRQAITGHIRKKQRSKLENDQKQTSDALKELKGYSKNPSRFGKTKLATTIRNHQIKSLTERAKNNKEALKELDSIEKHQAAKEKAKQEKIANSRYGKTNGRLAAEGVLNMIGTAALSSYAENKLIDSGHTKTAIALSVISNAQIIGTSISTARKMDNNYQPAKKKR